MGAGRGDDYYEPCTPAAHVPAYAEVCDVSADETAADVGGDSVSVMVLFLFFCLGMSTTWEFWRFGEGGSWGQF